MSVLPAVLLVGVGSLAFRLAPLLGTRRMPEGVARTAGWAGMAVIAGITVRSVLQHQDASLPAAPLVAAVSVATGLALALRGGSVLVAVGVGVSTYVLISAAAAALL
jgi:branched-subunit amino acid transport protein